MDLKIKNYFRDNIGIIVFSSFVILFIYAARLFNYNIGVDTEYYLFNAKYYNSLWNYEEGRFGLSILQLLFEGLNLRLNLFSMNFLACSFLIGSCMLWLAVFRYYSNYKNIYAELAFCLFYLSSKVWIEIIYFTFMATEVMFAVFLSPIFVYLTMEGIINKDYRRLISAIFLLVLIISAHQPIVVLAFAGLLVIYILRGEHSEKREFGMIIGVTAVGIVLYFAINYFLLQFVIKSELSGYVKGQIGGGYTAKQALMMIGVYVYSLFFANNPILNLIIDPAIEFFSQNHFVSSFAHDGASLLEHFHSRGLHGCSLFFPAVIIFLIFIFRKQNIKNKKLFRFAGIWFLCCGIVIAVVCGGVPAERYAHALPLVTSFLFFYTLMNMQQKCHVYIWFALILIFGFYQSQNSSLLNVSDQKRYFMDIELAEMIDDEIKNKIGYSQDDRELAVFGDYKFKYGKSYLRGEVIGKSVIMWGGYIKHDRPAMFMNVHGYNYVPVNKNIDIKHLAEYAEKMPSYPNDGWVSQYNGLILVKLSEQ